MYNTIEEAKAAAIEIAVSKYNNHAYVYILDGELDVMAHPEDRYLSSYIPLGAKILEHGEKITEKTDQGYKVSWVWESRGNHTQEEYNILKEALGTSKAKALWKFLNETEDE